LEGKNDSDGSVIATTIFCAGGHGIHIDGDLLQAYSILDRIQLRAADG
jgi:hypothetical protein